MTDELLWTAGAFAALSGVAVAALAGLAVFLAVGKRRWLPLQRLRPGRWGGYEVFLAFCVVNGLPLLIVAMLLQMGFFTPLLGELPEMNPRDPATRSYLLRSDMIASPLTLAAALGVLFLGFYVRSQTRPRHYGLSWARWPANLGLGVAAFLITTPLVLGLHALITLGNPEEHPFVELTRRMEGWEWIFLGFQAVVRAPLLEEILFRGILLGWLRRASLGGHIAVAALTVCIGFMAAPQAGGTSSAWDYVGPVFFALLGAAGYAFLMYRLARSFRLNETEIRHWQLEPANFTQHGIELASEETLHAMRHQHRDDDERRWHDWNRKNAWLAVYGSAMLFAVFHTEMWPAPVALIFLALALGWLALRTQSLIGPITLHALFNLVSFIALYGSTL